jgi:hypothetical protein
MRLHHLAAVRKSFTVKIFLLAALASAHAQAVNVTDLSATFGTVGTSVSLVVPALGDSRVPPARQTLFLANSAAAGSNSISCGYNAAISLNGVGTFNLPAGGPPAFWPRGTAPAQAIWCVASGASTPMQIVIGN